MILHPKMSPYPAARLKKTRRIIREIKRQQRFVAESVWRDDFTKRMESIRRGFEIFGPMAPPSAFQPEPVIKSRKVREKKQPKPRPRRTTPLSFEERIRARIYSFCRMSKVDRFTVEEFLDKFKDAKCYLTGVEIDLTNYDSYQLDHMVPISRGGSSKLSNLGLLSSRINMMKGNLSVYEFVSICKAVSDFNLQSHEVDSPNQAHQECQLPDQSVQDAWPTCLQ